MPEVKSEQELLRMLRNGEEEALQIIFVQHSRRLFAVTNRILNDAEVAKDIVQDVFCNLWNNSKNLNIISIQPYLVRSAVNGALMYIRKRNRFQHVTIDEFKETLHQDPPNIDYEILNKLVDTTIARMPAQRKTVFILSRYEQMSYSQIAEHLNISEKTVEKHISKALETLRSALGPYLKLFLLLLVL